MSAPHYLYEEVLQSLPVHLAFEVSRDGGNSKPEVSMNPRISAKSRSGGLALIGVETDDPGLNESGHDSRPCNYLQ